MIYYINYDGVGHLPCSIFKRSPIGALASLVGNAMNMAYQSGENERNRDFSREMFERQSGRQAYVNATSALTQKQSLKGAGLSPNMMAGSPPYSASVPLGDSSSQSAPQMDVASIASLLQNQPLIDAQARKDNAEAHSLEIENKRQETVDRHLDAYFKDKFGASDPADGEAVIDGNYRSYDKGTIDAQRMEREWENRSLQLDALDVQYQVDKMVQDERLGDSKTIQAIAKMPYYEKRKLYQEILTFEKNRDVMDSVIALNNSNASLADSQAALNQLQDEIQRNSNLAELIHKYLGDGAMADAAMFVAILLSGLNGNINVGAHVSKFKGKTESNSTSTNTNYNNSRSNSHVTVHKD